jgi:hypothetical protein
VFGFELGDLVGGEVGAGEGEMDYIAASWWHFGFVFAGFKE